MKSKAFFIIVKGRSIKKITIFLENGSPTLTEGKNFKISQGILMQMLMGWKSKCNFLCPLNLYNRYWNQVQYKHDNLFSTSLVSEQKQAKE